MARLVSSIRIGAIPGGWRRWFPVSYLGFAYGAAMAWAGKANSDLNLPLALDTFAFQDRAGVMGRLVYDLGNAYQKTGVIQNVASLLYSLHLYSLDNLRERAALLFHAGESRKTLFDNERLRDNLRATVEYIDEAISPIGQARMAGPDADLVKREYRAHGAAGKAWGATRLAAVIAIHR